jgi:alpha-1,2-glucosyltransferase
LLLLLCTFVVLVPSPLMEFRYYIIPYLLIAASSRKTVGLLSLLQSVFVNAVAIYVFLAFPFSWPNGEEARFMW